LDSFVNPSGQLLSLLFVPKIKSKLPLIKSAVKERRGFEVRDTVAFDQLQVAFTVFLDLNLEWLKEGKLLVIGLSFQDFYGGKSVSCK
jgi:hypothetical protein